MLLQDGTLSVQCTPYEAAPWAGRVLLWPEPTDSASPFFQHKTSKRELYNKALNYAHSNALDEVLFQNADGFFTEGATSNLFAQINGEVVTPPTEHGALPGVQRQRLLRDFPDIRECELTIANLQRTEHVWLCNAVRGVRAVNHITSIEGRVLWERRVDEIPFGTANPVRRSAQGK